MFTQKRNYQNSLWLVVRLQCNFTVLYLRWSHNKKLKVLTAGLQKLTIWYTESRIYTKTKKQMSVFFLLLLFCSGFAIAMLLARLVWYWAAGLMLDCWAGTSAELGLDSDGYRWSTKVHVEKNLRYWWCNLESCWTLSVCFPRRWLSCHLHFLLEM